MIDESTLQQIEAHSAAFHSRTTVNDYICLLLAEVRAQQQAPAPGEMMITREEWAVLSAQTRLNLRKWEMQYEEMEKAVDRGIDYSNKLGLKLARIENWCKLQPPAGADTVAAEAVRKVLGEIHNVINEGRGS
jgi:hypothetical protein